jgi:hypothetical protein
MKEVGPEALIQVMICRNLSAVILICYGMCVEVKEQIDRRVLNNRNISIDELHLRGASVKERSKEQEELRQNNNFILTESDKSWTFGSNASKI